MTAHHADHRSSTRRRPRRRDAERYWLLTGALVFFLEILVAVTVLQAVL